MTIDSATGVVSWANPIIGNQSVTLTVSDGHGGTATQSYLIDTQGTPNDHPPVFISTPDTTYNSSLDTPGNTIVLPTTIRNFVSNGDQVTYNGATVKGTDPDFENPGIFTFNEDTNSFDYPVPVVANQLGAVTVCPSSSTAPEPSKAQPASRSGTPTRPDSTSTSPTTSSSPPKATASTISTDRNFTPSTARVSVMAPPTPPASGNTITNSRSNSITSSPTPAINSGISAPTTTCTSSSTTLSL